MSNPACGADLRAERSCELLDALRRLADAERRLAVQGRQLQVSKADRSRRGIWLFFLGFKMALVRCALWPLTLAVADPCHKSRLH
jgi:hypothetical protein